MRIALFGATGRTGRIILEDALNAEHTISALVRDPSGVGLESPLLTVLTGSVQDPELVERAVTGADAVISVLGSSQNKPLYEISTATANIIAAMQRCGVHRLVMTAGAGVGDPSDAPGAFDRFMGVLVKLMAGNVYEDMRRSVDAVRASNLAWTILRVPVLTDAAPTGRVRVGYVGVGTGPRLSRADLADFVLRQVTANTYLHQAPVISN